MRRYFLIVLSLVLLGELNLAWSWIKPVKDRKEIIKFSHQKHLADYGAACANCHPQVETSTRSSDDNLPRMSDCGTCHAVDDTQQCMECHLDQQTLVPFDHTVQKILFSHKSHLAKSGLTCDLCHPGIQKVDYGNGTKLPDKSICDHCHDNLQANSECENCHSTTFNLRPLAHTPDWPHQHMVQVRSGQSDCAHCHRNSYCQECHQDVDLLSTGLIPGDRYPSYAPQSSGNAGMILKNVHDMNYRNTHPLDAKGKEKQCFICHQTSHACQECHRPEGDDERFRPTWHDSPDWGAITLGVGTGGGRHAELAERDIERCASCHDIEGRDPTCLRCHTDFDGIKGTDPKTHASGYLNRFSAGSPFHQDQGAVCYTCHTNTHEAGEGFCGYCHGDNRGD